LSLIDEIKLHEGFRSKPYKCTEGYLTIGYGQRLDYIKVDKKTAEKWLMEKVNKIKEDLNLRFPWYSQAPKEVQNIVVNMSYQIGISGFAKFKKTIKYLEQGLYHKASTEMLDSLWSKQTPERSKELSDRLKKIGDK
jgi:lysozyme